MLKDLTEEEARELLRLVCLDKTYNMNAALLDVQINVINTLKNWKQSGIIRKSPLEEAREKTDEFIDQEISPANWNTEEKINKLKKFILAEREAGKK